MHKDVRLLPENEYDYDTYPLTPFYNIKILPDGVSQHRFRWSLPGQRLCNGHRRYVYTMD
jgi:hypothetical protein